MMAGVMVSISMATFWGYGENTATSQISMVEVLMSTLPSSTLLFHLIEVPAHLISIPGSS